MNKSATMMIPKRFIKPQGNRIFLWVIIGLSFVAFNCAPTNKTYHLDDEMYFLSKQDNFLEK